MRKTLGAVGLLLLLAAGVVVNSLTPTPSAKARNFTDYIVVPQDFNWAEVMPDNYEYKGSFTTYGGASSHNMHLPRNLVTFLPSLGREATDFIELSRQVETQGFSTDIVDFISLKRDKPPTDLEEYAKTFAPHILTGDEKVAIVGHAFGNRVARKIANRQPGRVSAVILLAAGGQTPIPATAEQSLKNIFNPLRTYRSRMKDVRYAFFAEGNDIPDYWKRGWHTKTAMAQAKAIANSAGDESWHCAGGVPMLIVQPMQDRIAPIENAYALRDKCPQEVEIVEVQNAGHALLPEQPEAVAKAVLDFLSKHHPTDKNRQDTP